MRGEFQVEELVHEKTRIPELRKKVILFCISLRSDRKQHVKTYFSGGLFIKRLIRKV